MLLVTLLTNTTKKLNKFILNFHVDKLYITGIGPYLIGGIFVRILLKKSIANHYNIFSINTSKCSLCMKCINDCPTKSIFYEKGEFKFTSTCSTCMRCYNFCPENAISID